MTENREKLRESYKVLVWVWVYNEMLVVSYLVIEICSHTDIKGNPYADNLLNTV